MKLTMTKHAQAFGSKPSPDSLRRENIWHRMLTAAGQLFRVRTGPRRSLRLCETVSLGDRRFVAVLAYENFRFLLGGTSTSLVLLAELGNAECVSAVQENRANSSIQEASR